MKPARALSLLLAFVFAGAPTLGHAAPPGGDPADQLKEIVDAQKKLFAKAEAAGDNADQDELRSQLQQLAQQYDKLIDKNKDFTPAYVAYGLMLGKVGGW